MEEVNDIIEEIKSDKGQFWSLKQKLKGNSVIFYLYKKFNIFKNKSEFSALKKHLSDISKDTIIQSGFRKSGNTWLRFIIFHYYKIIEDNIDSPLSYNELNNLNDNVFEYKTMYEVPEKMPFIYRSHASFIKFQDLFNKSIYIYRNPLDTLISLYYYRINRVEPFSSFNPDMRQKLSNINYFVLYMLDWWLLHFKFTYKDVDLLISYDKAKKNPYQEFEPVIELIFNKVNTSALQRAIELSSFNNVQKMQERTNETSGMTDPDDFTGKFARKGSTGQFQYELNSETIKCALNIIDNFGIKRSDIFLKSQMKIFDSL